MKGRGALAAVAVLAFAGPAYGSEDDPWFARDKYLHGGVSVVVAGAGYAGAGLLGAPRPSRALTGLGAAVVVGAGKELWDMRGAGDPSWRDFSWDVAGGLVGVGLSYVLDLAISSAVR